ncbi:uncharacterized protein LOC123832071 [Phyllostomus hastatus]|uniref:uncharacterized protein LOC123832071 n=1 Tax=Phyllostomus hastatus TaxID=9423 RepID=UPI001E67F2FD|nr:uncharacterized protein LOC123832071 [Phyllostomus hastatus]
MSLANSSPRAVLLGVLLLVSLIVQNPVRSQLTPAPVQTCHSFHCFGEMCYQEAKFSNQMAECEPGQHHCELIQLNTSHYMARCSHSCERGYETGLSPCQLASTSAPSPSPCSLQCCSDGPHCLALNELALDLDHLIVPEDKLVPTPPAPNRNEKVCATFSCLGSECFKGQKAVAMCPKGLDFCELNRSSSGYTAGCSQACASSIYRCHGAMAQACSQECCQASASGSCLQLDGNLHFNRHLDLTVVPSKVAGPQPQSQGEAGVFLEK